MEPLFVSTEGITEAESMLLSMILSFASDQLRRNWQVKAGEQAHAVIYDLINDRARLAWEQHRSLSSPIPVVLSDKPIPGSPWVMPKPIRTHTVIPFLNNLSL